MKIIEHGDRYMFRCQCGCVFVAKQKECLHVDEDARCASCLCPECGEMVTELQEEDSFLMNARQSAKLAGMRVAELERILALNKVDIIEYNLCILSQIDGGSPCKFCEDYDECQLESKDQRGCGEWMMRSQMKRAEIAAREAEKAGEQSDDAGKEEGTGIESVQRMEEQ